MHSPSSPKHRHRAKAVARLRVPENVRPHLEESAALDESRVSGILAARRAGELLPHAPDVELTAVDIEFEWEQQLLHLSAFVEGVSRGHLGSRAMLAVNVCAANLVDVAEGEVELEEARVTMQSGGLDDLDYEFDPPVRTGVLVVSDAVAEGNKEDRAGETVRQAVREMAPHGVELAVSEILPDDRDAILEHLFEWRDRGADLVFTVGGTGLTHTDVTVEAVRCMVDREVPGLAEAIREYGREQTPLAFMSRCVAGLSRDTLIVALPGSSAGAKEAVEVIVPSVLHVTRTLRKSRELLQS